MLLNLGEFKAKIFVLVQENYDMNNFYIMNEQIGNISPSMLRQLNLKLNIDLFILAIPNGNEIAQVFLECGAKNVVIFKIDTLCTHPAIFQSQFYDFSNSFIMIFIKKLL